MKIESAGSYKVDSFGFSGWAGSAWQWEARSDLRRRRQNGIKKDSEGLQSKDPPNDGTYRWIKGKEGVGGFVYGKRIQRRKYEYEVEYHAGPKDVEWFCQIDCNYLARLEREGNLQKEEPDVWALRELDRVRGEQVNDIALCASISETQ